MCYTNINKTSITVILISIIAFLPNCRLEPNIITARTVRIEYNKTVEYVYDTIEIDKLNKFKYIKNGDSLFNYFDLTLERNLKEITQTGSFETKRESFDLIRDTLFNYNSIDLHLFYIGYSCGHDCTATMYFCKELGLLRVFKGKEYIVTKLQNKITKNEIWDIDSLNNLIEVYRLLNYLSKPPTPPLDSI